MVSSIERLHVIYAILIKKTHAILDTTGLANFKRKQVN